MKRPDTPTSPPNPRFPTSVTPSPIPPLLSDRLSDRISPGSRPDQKPPTIPHSKAGDRCAPSARIEHPSSSRTPSPRLTGLQLDQLRKNLTPIDLAVLSSVRELRLLSGRQIEQLHFPPDGEGSVDSQARNCRRVLGRLVEQRLLLRLPRQVGGIRGGSGAWVYGLDSAGHKLLNETGGRLRTHAPTEPFVTHQLDVAQLVVDVVRAEREGRCKLTELQGEPRCWRSVPGHGQRSLRPDLFLTLETNEYQLHWFVEVDRGTHHQPALLRKARLYESYYQSGVEQATYGVFPRVAWILSTPRRAEQLEKLFARAKLTDGLLLTATSDQRIGLLTGGAS